MKISAFIILIIGLSLVYAANKKCEQQERGKLFCTYEFAPVCGISKEGNKQVRTTHSNRCSACIDENTEFIIEGACEDFPENAIFCHPDAHLSRGCTKELIPVCGYFDNTIQCIRAPCAGNFSNHCLSCQMNQVAFSVPGHCE